MLATAILIAFNLVNIWIDAYKITVLKKAIRHGINFSLYAVAVGLCTWLFHLHLWVVVAFAVSAFFNRQITFDIPLNLRRGLKWNYTSLANPPKAIMDKIEVWLFGRNAGTEISIIYFCLWVISFSVQYFIK